MKKNILILVVAALFLGGCRYEEGVINFNSPENRLVGEHWQLQTVRKNGDKITEAPNDALQLYNYYTFYYAGPMSVTHFTETGMRLESSRGEWSFEDKNKKIYVFFTLRNRNYTYTATIVKLSGKELKYRYTDNNGDEWTLEFFKL
ncbi:hypothetical protein LJC68_10080 [Bacteroidales bacterium OttesenSCG-928-B11]|nr:hypothetical protein [Bacteroidales bacterium OttesenSCG-928-E04]MDL2313208.1 hypothetical protein [Bacteroidales bacterium OttesenSCG-928-B11]MDL2326917.1 hypothetical protein [Bacteroidales bacterium OttesenSCG-928-A14]